MSLRLVIEPAHGTQLAGFRGRGLAALENDTGAKITVESGVDGKKTVAISGETRAKEDAYKLIFEKLDSMRANMHDVQILIPPFSVAFMNGEGQDMLKTILSESGAHVEVRSSFDPGRMNITGSSSATCLAISSIDKMLDNATQDTSCDSVPIAVEGRNGHNSVPTAVDGRDCCSPVASKCSAFPSPSPRDRLTPGLTEKSTTPSGRNTRRKARDLRTAQKSTAEHAMMAERMTATCKALLGVDELLERHKEENSVVPAPLMDADNQESSCITPLVKKNGCVASPKLHDIFTPGIAAKSMSGSAKKKRRVESPFSLDGDRMLKAVLRVAIENGVTPPHYSQSTNHEELNMMESGAKSRSVSPRRLFSADAQSDTEAIDTSLPKDYVTSAAVQNPKPSANTNLTYFEEVTHAKGKCTACKEAILMDARRIARVYKTKKQLWHSACFLLAYDDPNLPEIGCVPSNADVQAVLVRLNTDGASRLAHLQLRLRKKRTQDHLAVEDGVPKKRRSSIKSKVQQSEQREHEKKQTQKQEAEAQLAKRQRRKSILPPAVEPASVQTLCAPNSFVKTTLSTIVEEEPGEGCSSRGRPSSNATCTYSLGGFSGRSSTELIATGGAQQKSTDGRSSTESAKGSMKSRRDSNANADNMSSIVVRLRTSVGTNGGGESSIGSAPGSRRHSSGSRSRKSSTGRPSSETAAQLLEGETMADDTFTPVEPVDTLTDKIIQSAPMSIVEEKEPAQSKKKMRKKTPKAASASSIEPDQSVKPVESSLDKNTDTANADSVVQKESVQHMKTSRKRMSKAASAASPDQSVKPVEMSSEKNVEMADKLIAEQKESAQPMKTSRKKTPKAGNLTPTDPDQSVKPVEKLSTKSMEITDEPIVEENESAQPIKTSQKKTSKAAVVALVEKEESAKPTTQSQTKTFKATDPAVIQENQSVKPVTNVPRKTLGAADVNIVEDNDSAQPIKTTRKRTSTAAARRTMSAGHSVEPIDTSADTYIEAADMYDIVQKEIVELMTTPQKKTPQTAHAPVLEESVHQAETSSIKNTRTTDVTRGDREERAQPMKTSRKKIPNAASARSTEPDQSVKPVETSLDTEMDIAESDSVVQKESAQPMKSSRKKETKAAHAPSLEQSVEPANTSSVKSTHSADIVHGDQKERAQPMETSRKRSSRTAHATSSEPDQIVKPVDTSSDTNRETSDTLIGEHKELVQPMKTSRKKSPKAANATSIELDHVAQGVETLPGKPVVEEKESAQPIKESRKRTSTAASATSIEEAHTVKEVKKSSKKTSKAAAVALVEKEESAKPMKQSQKKTSTAADASVMQENQKLLCVENVSETNAGAADMTMVEKNDIAQPMKTTRKRASTVARTTVEEVRSAQLVEASSAKNVDDVRGGAQKGHAKLTKPSRTRTSKAASATSMEDLHSVKQVKKLSNKAPKVGKPTAVEQQKRAESRKKSQNKTPKTTGASCIREDQSGLQVENTSSETLEPAAMSIVVQQEESTRPMKKSQKKKSKAAGATSIQKEAANAKPAAGEPNAVVSTQPTSPRASLRSKDHAVALPSSPPETPSAKARVDAGFVVSPVQPKKPVMPRRPYSARFRTRRRTRVDDDETTDEEVAVSGLSTPAASSAAPVEKKSATPTRHHAAAVKDIPVARATAVIPVQRRSTPVLAQSAATQAARGRASHDSARKGSLNNRAATKNCAPLNSAQKRSARHGAAARKNAHSAKSAEASRRSSNVPAEVQQKQAPKRKKK